jgi:hypothetical protein
MYIPVVQYTNPDGPGTRLEIRTDIRGSPVSFKNFIFFFRLTEIIALKPELYKKLTCFTEATLFYSLSLAIAPGTEYACTSRIRWAGFADTGFQVMV